MFVLILAYFMFLNLIEKSILLWSTKFLYLFLILLFFVIYSHQQRASSSPVAVSELRRAALFLFLPGRYDPNDDVHDAVVDEKDEEKSEGEEKDAGADAERL